jgi:hypothetical protein
MASCVSIGCIFDETSAPDVSTGGGNNVLASGPVNEENWFINMEKQERKSKECGGLAVGRSVW